MSQSVEVLHRPNPNAFLQPVGETARAVIIERITRVHWPEIVRAPERPSEAARAEFARWTVHASVDAALEDYENAIAEWASSGKIDARYVALGGAPAGGMWLGPGTCERLSDRALTGSGWRIVAVQALSDPLQIIAIYVERVAP